MSDTGDSAQLMARALHELQRAQQRIDELERAGREPIAITGAACRLPGGIDSPAALWQFLAAGREATAPVPRERWDVDRFYDPRPGQPGRIAARAGCFLDDVLGFDAAFFGIAPREAELMDPQQRLLLECSWHAFEDAGLAVDRLRDSSVGVFVGISTIDYAYHLVDNVQKDAVTGHCGTGTTHAVAAGRIAYCLDLRGPCLALDTACSSSLVALHLACQSLRAGECDHALVAGVNAMLSPLTAASFSHARMLAPDGRCKTFAQDADGYARGEGVVALLLTRASVAAARGLRVRAEVLGTAVNQDGRSAGLTVPNGPAQAAVIRRALAQANLPPAAIDVVEAHGTGTALGDPIELQALGAVFAPDRPPQRPLRVASIKTNLGHTEAAAGVLSVLKAVLQLQHARIAPHLHLDRPNPHVPWASLPLTVPTAPQPWPHGDRRHAGVSSFGFSGTNAHAVLRSAEPPPTADTAPTQLLLPLSATDESAFAALAAALQQRLRGADARTALDLCYTMAVGRSALRLRGAVCGRGGDELADALAGLVPGQLAGRAPEGPAAALLAAFVRGDHVDCSPPLAAQGGRRADAPLYPFTHRRFVCVRPAVASTPQFLVETAIALPPAAATAAPRAWCVHGELAAPLAAALRAAGHGVHGENAAIAGGSALFVAPNDGEIAAEDTLLALGNWLRRDGTPPAPGTVLCRLDAEAAPLALALRAGLRAARAELPQRELRWIGVAADATPAAITTALAADPREDELEVRGDAVLALRLQARSLAAAAPPPLRPDRSYLLTGGLGALGPQFAEYLLQAGARNLWLASRRGGAVPSDLARSAARHGARVLVLQVDVSAPADVALAIARIGRDGPPLDGVFHLAGVLDDALLPGLERHRITAQFAPKLRGAWNLHRATADLPLRYFVCTSSAAAWLGNAAQFVYAAANGALEGVGRRRRALGLPATVLAFGPWQGSGMAASPAAAAHLRAHGIRLLAASAALHGLASVLATDTAEAALLDIDWTLFARTAGRPLSPRFDALAATPPTQAAPRNAPASAAAVATIVASVLGQPAGTVAADAPLAGLGLDSLLAVDVQHRLASDLGIELPIGTILAAGDCRGIAAAAAAPTTAAAASATPPSTTDAELQQLVAGLDDAAVRALLARDPGRAPPDA